MSGKRSKNDPVEEGRLTGGFLQRNHEHDAPTIRNLAKDLSKPQALPLEKGSGKGRKTPLAAFGLNPGLIREGDPQYAAALYQANKYRKQRMKELAKLHGHVSSGAGALLASASLALAASRFLYELYSRPVEEGGGSIELLKQAGTCADKARTAELSAWELAAREGVLKRRQEASDQGMPWLQKLDGSDRAKLGRKTNKERQERAMLESGTLGPSRVADTVETAETLEEDYG